MNAIETIEMRRNEILIEMEHIRSMELGTLKEQMLPSKRKDQVAPVMLGPYYVLARWQDGKTNSRRVSGEELAQVKQDVENHQRFVALYKEYEELTQWLGRLERETAELEETVKKKPKSRSQKTKKFSES